jgi:hypothetical protein
MVNRSRNNAKSRRRSRRGGQVEEVIVDNENIPPSKIEVDIKTPETGDESWTSGITSGFNKLTDEAKNLVGENKGEEGALSSMTNSVTGFFSSEPTVESKVESQDVAKVPETGKSWYEVWKGGRRGSRRRYQQGGRGLGLNYYATPVNGLRVAEPTYMEYYKGGKRRNTKRRTRRCKSKRCKKTCRKHHRHCRK